MRLVGSVVISIDAELGWGFHDLENLPRNRVESGRRGWNQLLELLEEYDVPATWAVVGHLMLEECDGVHATHPTPEGWFERERTSWSDRPDLRFGPDLVRSVLDSPVDHEFASHSFSHVLFGDPNTTREIANAELERCVELATDWGQSIDSFVFPRNEMGHREVLADHGVRAYRSRSPNPLGIRGVLESPVRNRTPLVEPTIDEYGLVDIPPSHFLFAFEGAMRTAAETLWEDPMVAMARRGIDEAVDADGVYHLWLHPNNLKDEQDDDRLRAILDHLDHRRRETESLRIDTMTDVANRVLPGDPRSRYESRIR